MNCAATYFSSKKDPYLNRTNAALQLLTASFLPQFLNASHGRSRIVSSSYTENLEELRVQASPLTDSFKKVAVSDTTPQSPFKPYLYASP